MGISREETYRKHAAELTHFATALVGPASAQDVVADAVLRAMWSRAWPSVRNPRAYLYRAVLNEARMHHRSRTRRVARERRVAVPDRHVDAEARPDVAAAVAALSVRQRATVFLTYWEGLTPGEVAARLGIGEGSVRRHLARARAHLREALDD